MNYEFCVEQGGNDRLYISTDYQPLINKLMKVIHNDPQSFRVIKEARQNDGCLYVSVPTKYLLFTFKKRGGRKLTEEQRDVLCNRLKCAREQQLQKKQQENPE